MRLAFTPGVPRDALFGAKGPQWVAIGGAGTDHYGKLDSSNTIVTSADVLAPDMMAEFVFGSFLHFTPDVSGLHKNMAAKAWNARTVAPLSGKTLLIVELGHTGQAVASRAKAFGMTVLGTRTTPRRMAHVHEVHPAGALIGLLPRADFIVVCPL